MRKASIVLAASLARGIGWRTEVEGRDLLLQDAPGNGDIFGGALAQLGRKPDDPEIAEVAALLSAPLHPIFYLCPSELAERFTALPAKRGGRWLRVLSLAALLVLLGLATLVAFR